MLLRSVISSVAGFRFLVDNMELQSGVGKRYLLDTAMMYNAPEIEEELGYIEKALTYINDPGNKRTVEQLHFKLSHVRDIRGSIRNIGQDVVLDDIELFEIKSFALLVEDITVLQAGMGTGLVTLPSLSAVVDILDPDKTRIPSFYIYDSYCAELGNLRKQIKALKAGETASVHQDNGAEQLQEAVMELERTVRQDISARLKIYHRQLAEALESIAHLDVIVAKALLARRYGLSKPVITMGPTYYQAMFHPQIQQSLAKENKVFQPIDIRLDDSVCFITGANMAGKTVVLKTLVLCQYLVQYGFYVPSLSAQISLVNKIMVSVGDDQSEQNGLSSFASEMIKINEMVVESQRHNKVLILIDELARTTNPDEGVAIVNAVANMFYKNNTRSVITTHYSGLSPEYRKLRVKGLHKDIDHQEINKDNINNFIDYSLVEDQSGTIPHEALRIAAMLGVSQEIVDEAQCQLQKKEDVKENRY